MKIILKAIIKFYMSYISPIKPRTCRFHPTCSKYAYDAIEEYGSIKGTWKSIKRISKCHPFNPGGYDPIKLEEK